MLGRMAKIRDVWADLNPDSNSQPHVSDARGRRLRDLRISVTDRCNFRCVYCMPRSVFGEEHAFLPKKDVLTFEELARLASAFVQLGAEKIRLTGGEPLLRRDLPALIRLLRAIPGLRDLALTTNGSLLDHLAGPLRAAGLERLTVSLDSLNEETFAAMSDADFPLRRVLAGIEAAVRAGFAPIKINMVVKRGLNDHEVVAMARRFARPPFILRFIEYMDVGNTNGWRLTDLVPTAEIIARLQEELPLRPLSANYRGEVAQRFRFQEGEIGFISSVTEPFCGDCTRARLSADGRLFTCLFTGHGHDLRGLLRSGASEAELQSAIGKIWRARDDRYSELRFRQTSPAEKAEMSLLGG